MRFTIGSLFSGIGGLDLALEGFGGEVVWQADSDPFCRAVLAKHWPGVRCYEDVRDIDVKAERVDVICGGFPCQPVSVAGSRKGKDDARWLWPEFARIVSVLRPHAVFIENVPGLRTLGLRDVLADLARLGFDAEWGCFTAAEVGAPHIRRRLFILAYSDRELGWLQPRRIGGSLGTDSTVAGNDGAALTVADAASNGQRPGRSRGPYPGGSRKLEQPLQDMANTDGHGEQQPQGSIATERGWVGDESWWAVEPDVGRVVARVPVGVDRLRALGNAVVPQCAALAWEVLTGRAARTEAA